MGSLFEMFFEFRNLTELGEIHQRKFVEVGSRFVEVLFEVLIFKSLVGF